uniref:Uncharacterized protein n=1 Tax=Arundo donax TaxID=35708 RepID=A0A0A8ZK38_ARUDO
MLEIVLCASLNPWGNRWFSSVHQCFPFALINCIKFGILKNASALGLCFLLSFARRQKMYVAMNCSGK